MESEREPTQAERVKAMLYDGIREWLTEWNKDDLVLLATVLMVENGLRDK